MFPCREGHKALGLVAEEYGISLGNPEKHRRKGEPCLAQLGGRRVEAFWDLGPGKECF